MKHKSDHQPYRSEFCSQDPIIRGVAISRLAQGLSAICEYILRKDSDLEGLLNAEVYKTIRAEAEALQPNVAILNGAGLPSRAGKKAKSMQLGAEKTIVWKKEHDVKEAAAYLANWLRAASKLRAAMKILGQGGLWYTTHVDVLCMRAYSNVGPGSVAGTMVGDAVARLCQGETGTGSSTQISDDKLF